MPQSRREEARMSAFRSGSYGIGLDTTRRGATGPPAQEGAVPAEGRVLPRPRRAVVAREPLARQAREARVEPIELGVAGALHHHPQRLVVPERDARAVALHEALDHLGLRLRGGSRSRLVHTVLVPPAIGGVA